MRLAVVGLLLLAGCAQEEATQPEPLNPAHLTLVAAHVAATTSLGLETFGLSVLGDAYPGSPPLVPLPGDTLFRGTFDCPVVTVEGTGDDIGSLLFGYDPGCASDVNGLFGRGTLRLAYQTLDLPVEASYEFDRFERGNAGIDGVLGIEWDPDGEAALEAFALVLSTPGGTALMGGTFTARFDAAPSEGDSLCLGWSVPEGAADVQAGGRLYVVRVLETLRGSTRCAYPVAGRARASLSGVGSAEIDYGDGTCDNRAVMISEGREIALTLGTEPTTGSNP